MKKYTRDEMVQMSKGAFVASPAASSLYASSCGQFYNTDKIQYMRSAPIGTEFYEIKREESVEDIIVELNEAPVKRGRKPKKD